MGFSRQEYWSGLPCPPPGDLPSPGIEFRNPTLPLPENLLDSTIWATRETPWARASYITFLGFCFDMCEVGLMMRSPSERQAVRDGLSPHWLQDDGPTGGRPSLCDQRAHRGRAVGSLPSGGDGGAPRVSAVLSAHTWGEGAWVRGCMQTLGSRSDLLSSLGLSWAGSAGAEGREGSLFPDSSPTPSASPQTLPARVTREVTPASPGSELVPLDALFVECLLCAPTWPGAGDRDCGSNFLSASRLLLSPPSNELHPRSAPSTLLPPSLHLASCLCLEASLHKIHTHDSPGLPAGPCLNVTSSGKTSLISLFKSTHRALCLSPVFWSSLSLSLSSIAQSCLTLWDPMDCSTPGLPVHHQLLELTQTHVHRAYHYLTLFM